MINKLLAIEPESIFSRVYDGSVACVFAYPSGDPGSTPAMMTDTVTCSRYRLNFISMNGITLC